MGSVSDIQELSGLAKVEEIPDAAARCVDTITNQ
jgi:hypothetical protein